MPYFGMLVLLLWVVALIDLITADADRVRNLPKMGWLVVVILIPLAGSLIWFALGRPVGAAVSRPSRTTGFTEYERPGRQLSQLPDDDEEFLRQCRARAEEQRRRVRDADARNPRDTPDGDA